MIAHATSLATVLCAALLAACGPAATDARTPTPLLRGGLSTPPHHAQAASSSSSISSISSISSLDYSVGGYLPADGFAVSQEMLRDPTCNAKPNTRPCCPRCGPNGRCRVPGTSDVIRVCNRAVAADGSSGGAAAFVDGVPANDAASGTDEALSYYTDEEEYGEDAI